MADLLGSLLPPGYAAPGVQAVLGGDLAYLNCPNGSRPCDVCNKVGTSPFGACDLYGTVPGVKVIL